MTSLATSEPTREESRDGLLGGLAGAAEYEKLNGILGLASRGMVSQSFGHVAVVIFILAGNILHFATRRVRQGVQES